METVEAEDSRTMNLRWRSPRSSSEGEGLSERDELVAEAGRGGLLNAG